MPNCPLWTQRTRYDNTTLVFAGKYQVIGGIYLLIKFLRIRRVFLVLTASSDYAYIRHQLEPPQYVVMLPSGSEGEDWNMSQ